MGLLDYFRRDESTIDYDTPGVTTNVDGLYARLELKYIACDYVELEAADGMVVISADMDGDGVRVERKVDYEERMAEAESGGHGEANMESEP